MQIDKMRELYQAQQKTAPKSLETQKMTGSWYQDDFVKKILVALVVILAVSTIAGIAFAYCSYSEMRDSIAVMSRMR